MRRVIDEMDAPRVVEGAGVALEPVREPPEKWRDGRRALARGRPAVLGHEMVGTLALADVVADRRNLLDALAEDASHEEREVADVLGHRHLVLGLEVRAVPGGAGLEQQVHDRLEPGNRRPARVQVLDPREARQQIGEIRRGRVVADGQVVEARPERTIEKRAKLHTGNDSKIQTLLESEPVAGWPIARIPWFLVAASTVLLLLVLYVLFVGYLPSKQRVAGLEAELKDLYKREAELQTKIAQQDQRSALRERQLTQVTIERDTLLRRLEEVEKLLAAARGQRPPGR